MNRLPMLVLLFAVVLVPLSAVHAQDGKKKTDADFKLVWLGEVWAKLQAAVDAGKMSAEDAEAKMIAIKKMIAINKAKMGAGKKETDYEAIGKELKAAVKAGKLTKEEAKAKWAAIKKTAGG